tara:strand:- start:11 stop:448 length:438 start_codon:yes stop_codon:yes gene_type:complete
VLAISQEAGLCAKKQNKLPFSGQLATAIITWRLFMTIDYASLKGRNFPEIEQEYTSQDTILYALGIGVGADPLDENQVQFTFEEAQNFSPLPTMPVVMAGPGFWVREPDSGVTWEQVLHGEQRLRLHSPMPPEGVVDYDECLACQ